MLLAGLLCRSSECVFAAAFLTAVDGKYYYEVEVLEAEGYLYVGFAGTNLGPQCSRVGNDSCSWSIYMYDGDGRHGCVCG